VVTGFVITIEPACDIRLERCAAVVGPITARQGPSPSEPMPAKRVVFGPRVRGTDQHALSHVEAQPYGLKPGSKRPKTGLSVPE
jgi:hypothetical protein